MKHVRRFPDLLAFRIERLAFALFAMLWTTNLAGCNNTIDSVIAKYGGPSPEDTLVAKYGSPADTLPDTISVRYGVPMDTTPVDPIIAKYGVPVPTIEDPPIAKYGCPPSICGPALDTSAFTSPALDAEEIARRWGSASSEGAST